MLRKLCGRESIILRKLLLLVRRCLFNQHDSTLFRTNRMNSSRCSVRLVRTGREIYPPRYWKTHLYLGVAKLKFVSCKRCAYTTLVIQCIIQSSIQVLWEKRKTCHYFCYRLIHHTACHLTVLLVYYALGKLHCRQFVF